MQKYYENFMTSLYIHIPFCEQKCFIVRLSFPLGNVIGSMIIWIVCRLRPSDTKRTECASVFLGGGTPSYLEADQLKRLFKIVEENFSVRPDAEYTIEANPESLDAAKLEALRSRHQPDQPGCSIIPSALSEISGEEIMHQLKARIPIMRSAMPGSRMLASI